MESLTLVSFVVLFIAEILFFHVLNHVGGFRKLLSKYQSFVESQLGFSDDSKCQVEKKQQNCVSSTKGACFSTENVDDEVIRREDIEIVMEKLGLFCTPNDQRLKNSLDSNDVSNIFEQKEPSLEELKEAFDVFDGKKDGFIDAEELQSVLSTLGLKEGLNIQNCRTMICSFDQNGDDRIDFNEFVTVMENGFC